MIPFNFSYFDDVSSTLPIPHDFEKIIKELLGTEHKSFFDSLKDVSPASIRINPNKNYVASAAKDIPWTKYGKYLNDRPIYTLDPMLHAGAYYVQEPSSMFLEHVVKNSIDLDKANIALDLCAAPGGKSTHLLSLLSTKSLLVSNEVIRSRASILVENIQKWGNANVIVTNNDPTRFSRLTGLFDLIVVDAPCSGEGLFRKDPSAINEWSLKNVELCSLRQRRILKDIWPALKQNGILIYSTCTYNTKEDEETLEWIKSVGDVDFVKIPIDPEWGIVESSYKGVHGYRFYPHKVKGEGFFIAVMRKIEAQAEVQIRAHTKLAKVSKEISINKWLKNPEVYAFFTNKEGVIGAVPETSLNLVNFLATELNPIMLGLSLAINKRGKLVPEHAAALSSQLNKEHFKIIELTLPQALQYLRKETIEIPISTKGYALVTYKNNPLGWLNMLDNRMNNMYPSNWRIRMKNTG